MLLNTQPARTRLRARQQQQQQQQQRQQQGPEQLQDEVVWTVLLQHMLEYSQAHEVARVARKLLSCSQAMASFVHSVCAGRLEVSISLPDDTHNPHKSRVYSAARWLARHARLVHTLRQWCILGVQAEDALAAGLSAASGREMVSVRRLTRSHASEAHALAAVSAGAVVAPFQQGLLLREVHTRSSTGSMLSCLRGMTQLTSLNLTLYSPSTAAAWQRTIPTLVGLQQLELRLDGDCEIPRPALHYKLVPPLQHLTQLTQLSLQEVTITQHLASYFPLSLQSLDWGGHHQEVKLAHLTSLTQLKLPLLYAEDVIPSSLQALHVRTLLDSSSPALPMALLQLSRLQQLGLQHFPSATVLQQLQRLSTLKEVCLTHTTGHPFARDDPSRALSLMTPHMARLPLKALTLAGVHCLSSDFEPLHQCSHLTRLMCSSVHLGDSLIQLSEQLQRLPALQYFWWGDSSAPSMLNNLQEPAADDARAFLQGFTRMPALRGLTLVLVRLGSVALELSAATQLRQLRLFGCEVDSATEAALESQLAASGCRCHVECKGILLCV